MDAQSSPTKWDMVPVLRRTIEEIGRWESAQKMKEKRMNQSDQKFSVECNVLVCQYSLSRLNGESGLMCVCVNRPAVGNGEKQSLTKHTLRRERW